MQIQSATFIKGVVGTNEILENGTPQVAFIGRSNAGKSSLLNSLTGKKDLAVTSKTPGRTKQINIFSINDTHYFVDLPGYGYAKLGGKELEKLSKLIFWYLLDTDYDQKVVLLIDSVVGPTSMDLDVLADLQKAGRDIVIVLNKADKIKKSHYLKRMKELQEQFNGFKVFPYSSVTKAGKEELLAELLQ